MAKPMTRNPARRSTFIACVVALAGANAWNASTTAWFTGVFAGTGGQSTLTVVTLDSMTHEAMVDSPTGGVAATYSIMGMPGPRAWLLVALGLVLVAVFLRMSLFAVMSLGALWAARSSATSAEHTLMSVVADDRFSHNGTGFVTFLDWLWVTAGLVVVLALQINHANGVLRRERELVGETAEPGVLDMLENISQSLTSRYSRLSATKASGTAKENLPTSA